MEHKELLRVPWDWQIGEHAGAQVITPRREIHSKLCSLSFSLCLSLPAGLFYVGFSAFMFSLYSFMPVVMKRTSAASVNLSLLTADLYSLFCGLFLFHYKVTPAIVSKR